jgi:hypothetical protein
MRSVPALAALVIGAMALVSGCGQQHQGTPAGPPLGGSSASAPSPSPAPQPGDPGTASCQGSSATRAALITVTYADNGQTLCVRRGTAVQVFLKGSPANRWSPIRASNGALESHANGHMMLALGVTGASFLAVRPGTVIISSWRQPCGPDQTPPNAAAPSGTLECGVIIAFRTIVKVT